MAMMFRCFLPGEEKRLFHALRHPAPVPDENLPDLDLLDNRTIFTNRTPGTLKLGSRAPYPAGRGGARLNWGWMKCSMMERCSFLKISS